MMQDLKTTIPQTLPITSIETQPIIEHGESPTAIILAIAVLISILLAGITKLARVLIMTKSSR
jgi:hypothetical protein